MSLMINNKDNSPGRAGGRTDGRPHFIAAEPFIFPGDNNNSQQYCRSCGGVSPRSLAYLPVMLRHPTQSFPFCTLTAAAPLGIIWDWLALGE